MTKRNSTPVTQSEFLFTNPPDTESDKKPVSTKQPNPPKNYSVTQLTRLIKLTLTEHLPKKIIVEAELSNCKFHHSGHLYVTLKDEHAHCPSVMWKSSAAKLKFKPTEGMAVIATGRIDVYEPLGKYQFYIDKLEPAGIGPLELAFRQLSDKLRKEGLFNPKHKKTLPTFPQTIAIVTSASGAAIEDIKKTLHRRFPIVKKILFPVPVQGEAAAAQIAAAINHINRRTDAKHIDLIILARGGGSIEDLWAFNEEPVARAIHQSIIPIITGIGHETDLTIADLVADQHAITPTAAAELAVPLLEDILENLRLTQQRLTSNVRRCWNEKNDTFTQLTSRPLFARPLDRIRFKQQHMDEYSSSLGKTLAIILAKNQRTLETHLRSLQKIEPHNVINLNRTYLRDRLIRLKSTFQLFYQNQKHHLSNITLKHQAASPTHTIQKHTTQLNYINNRLKQSNAQTLLSTNQKIEQIHKRLQNLDPHAILNRGYSITRKSSDQSILTNKNPLHIGDTIVTELAEKNTLESKITKIKPPNPRPIQKEKE